MLIAVRLLGAHDGILASHATGKDGRAEAVRWRL
jgi:hypothetical protein